MPIPVVIPAYNAAWFISEAIESVLAQTHRDFELIVVNDGSTDNTLAIAEQYAAMDKRIKVYTHRNMGTALTLNRGIELTEGEWIFLMHADDRMRPNRLERQLDFIRKHPELSLISSLVRHIDGKGRVIGRDNSKLVTAEAVERAIAANGLIGISHPAVAFRKRAVLDAGGYRQAFWPAEDTDLWNRMVERGAKVLVQPEYLLDYRMHGNAASIAQASLTRAKARWLKECMLARRRGVEEPDWDSFLTSLHAALWPIRLNRARKDLAKTYYKAAVLHYAERKYVPLFCKLGMAILLQPGMTLSVAAAKFSLEGRRDGV